MPASVARKLGTRPLLGPSTAERLRHFLVLVTVDATTLLFLGALRERCSRPSVLALWLWALLPVAGLLSGSVPSLARSYCRGDVAPLVSACHF
jgi:hypothetical protein